MIKSAISRSVFVLALCAALPACGDVRRMVTFEKTPPDEFQVVQRAPLALPPDFTLRPPAPGTVRPQEGTPRERAKAALQGPAKVQPISTTNRDSADIALLKRVGAESVQKDVRELVDKEALAVATEDKGFTEKLLFWQDKKQPGDGEQLNADAETARLRDKPSLAKGTTDGVNPRIEAPGSRTGGGTFDWIRWPF